MVELGLALRERVLPQLGSHAGRARGPAGAGGDPTFAIDSDAEHFLERFLLERAPDVAYYSEDRGLVLPQGAIGAGAPSELPEFPSKEIQAVQNKTVDPQADRPVGEGTTVLVVDPIDGTRPAMAGFESCCVSVAAAPLGDGRPTMGDVCAACIVEIKSGARFVAERGAGVELRDGAGRLVEPRLSGNEDLTALFWTSGFRGRPAQPLVEVLGELIDLSSVGGAFFDLGSATFDITRILTGQLDAYLDVGSLMIDAVPNLRSEFERVGGGAVLNNSPYDLAGAVLCLEEAGVVVSDARGEPLDGRPLLGSGHEYQMSCVAAASARLHSDLLRVVASGIERLLARRQ